MTSTTPVQPEVWLRGPVAGVPAALQPVAHALLQAVEDVDRLTAGLEADELWARPGGAASVGFHLRHAAGSLDRLLTYARGEQLHERQLAALAAEKALDDGTSAQELLKALHDAVACAFHQLREASPETLDERRAVGRAGLPSTTRGLLHHAAEHTARHVGQMITTLRVVRGLGGRPAG